MLVNFDNMLFNHSKIITVFLFPEKLQISTSGLRKDGDDILKNNMEIYVYTVEYIVKKNFSLLYRKVLMQLQSVWVIAELKKIDMDIYILYE